MSNFLGSGGDEGGIEISLARSSDKMDGFRLAFVNANKVELAPIVRIGVIFFADCGNGDDGGVENSLVRGEDEIDAFGLSFQSGLMQVLRLMGRLCSQYKRYGGVVTVEGITDVIELNKGKVKLDNILKMEKDFCDHKGLGYTSKGSTSKKCESIPFVNGNEAMYRNLAKQQRAIIGKHDRSRNVARHVPNEKQKWVPKRSLQCNVAHMSDVCDLP
ncbi:hypothetical protein Syun_006527 [Stephania yunnanensis]|uniref:Uncharacterized protein n=1 Tax=Stephania yunnanensis TaxID=152371 RepID=A0AAP0KX15_9MAGN